MIKETMKAIPLTGRQILLPDNSKVEATSSRRAAFEAIESLPDSMQAALLAVYGVGRCKHSEEYPNVRILSERTGRSPERIRRDAAAAMRRLRRELN